MNVAVQGILGLLVAAGFFLVGQGLLADWPKILPWEKLTDFYGVLAIYFAAVALAMVTARLFRLRFFATALVLVVAITLATGNFGALLAVSALLCACVALGDGLAKLMKLKHWSSIEERLLIGAGIYGTIISVIAFFPVNYPGVYALAIAAPIVWMRRPLVRRLRLALAFSRAPREKPLRLDLVRLATFGVIVIHLLVSLLPEVGADGVGVHMLIPSTLFAQAHWGFDPHQYVWSVTTMLANWLFAIGYMLAGETSAKLIHFAFTLVLARQSFVLARWAGAGRHARWAPLLLLTSPIVYTETSSLYNDVVWSCFLVAGSMAIFRFAFNPGQYARHNLIYGAATFGFALATKALTLLYIPVLTLVLLYRIRSLFSARLALASIAAVVIFLISAAPPYATAFLVTGNPVFPFFNEIFKSPYFEAKNFTNQSYHNSLAWDTFYEFTFGSAKYIEGTNGASGFMWLLALPATLFALLAPKRRWRALLVVGVSIACIGATFSSQSYLRYILPVFAMISGVIAASFAREDGGAESASWPPIVIASWATVALNLLFITAGSWTYRSLPIQALVNEEHRRTFLETHSPMRLTTKLLNEINDESRSVAFFTVHSYGGGLHANALYANWYNPSFLAAATALRSKEQVGQIMLRFGATFLILDEAWGTPEARDAIRAATEEVASFRGFSVRRLPLEAEFTTDLVRNGDLNGPDNWGVPPGAVIQDGVARVTVDLPITQIVKVTEGKQYLNEVEARCLSEKTTGRVQINWMSAADKIVGVSIQVWECEPNWNVYRQTVTAPADAATAMVYGAGHTEKPIEINKISMRARE